MSDPLFTIPKGSTITDRQDGAIGELSVEYVTPDGTMHRIDVGISVPSMEHVIVGDYSQERIDVLDIANNGDVK